MFNFRLIPLDHITNVPKGFFWYKNLNFVRQKWGNEAVDHKNGPLIKKIGYFCSGEISIRIMAYVL